MTTFTSSDSGIDPSGIDPSGIPPIASNKAAVLYGVHDLRIEQRPIPEPAPGEVLVAMRSVGVCGSDVHYYNEGRIGSFVLDSPTIMGHESSGVIIGVGDQVDALHIGQRVALEPGVPCGTCTQCRLGRYNLCPDMKFFASPPVDGAFVQYLTINQHFAYPVPDTLSDDAAALMEPFSVGIWACHKAGVAAGARVLVTGAGPIGVMALQAANAFGATEVIVTDTNTYRLERAVSLGASRAVDVSGEDDLSAQVAADILIECSGAPQALMQGMKCLSPAGIAVAVGMASSDDLLVPMSVIQSKELTLTGTFRYANTYPVAISLAAAGRVDLDACVTGYYPLEETEAAFLAAKSDPRVLKSVVRPNGI